MHLKPLPWVIAEVSGLVLVLLPRQFLHFCGLQGQGWGAPTPLLFSYILIPNLAIQDYSVPRKSFGVHYAEPYAEYVQTLSSNPKDTLDQLSRQKDLLGWLPSELSRMQPPSPTRR